MYFFIFDVFIMADYRRLKHVSKYRRRTSFQRLQVRLPLYFIIRA